jgi:PAS domain S-box-containing protein
LDKNRCKILLIEDNLGDARLIHLFLSEDDNFRFSLENAEELKEGMLLLDENNNFDVILLDLALPDSFGLETLAKVQEKVPNIAIVILTGNKDEEMALKAVENGAQDYLAKGQINSSLLIRSIQYAIQRKKAENKIQHLNAILRALRNINQLITFEKKRDKLLKKACNELVKTRGYHRGWIILTDKKGRFSEFIETCSEEDKPRKELLKEGELPECAHKALKRGGLVVIQDMDSDCENCPLINETSGNGSMITLLKHKERLYGLLLVYAPESFVNDIEEQELFQELAGDIALGLHSIELEKKQEEIEEEYKRLINGMNDAAFVIDFDGSFIEVNDAALKSLGYSREELLSMGPQDIDSRLKAKDIKLLIKGMKTDKIQVFETEYMTKNGDRIPVEISSSLVTHQGKPAILSVARNITERKKAEEKLKESEERYRTLFENSAEGILVANIETKQFLYANPAICNMLGYSKEELTQMSVSDIHPKKFLKHVISEFEAQARGEKYLAPDIPCLRKDGTIISTDIVTSKMVIGEKKCNVGFFTDITEHKKAEEEKENLNQQLLQAQKMESVGRLAGTIAHDFNNLLTAIIGYGYLLYDELKTGDPKKAMMEEIINAANQAANLTGQLLAFSRKKPVKLEVFNMNSIITDTEGMIHRLIGEDIKFSSYLKEELKNIKGDSTQIEQVILNLIVNARDAMPKGGKLTLKTENVSIGDKETRKIPSSRAGDFVCLSVTDTGVGIDKKTLPKIFDPFFTTKKSGTGLGLSVVREIVEKHDGWVNVESTPGKDTTFRIYLPVSLEEKTKKTKEVVPIADLQGNGELILVVEDEEITRNFIVRVLKENGYSVLETENIEEAAEVFEENKEQIKMVFSDVVLPDGSGLEFAEELITKDENTKILLSSGYIDEKAELSHIAQRKFKFLEKPYDVPKLLTEIKRILSE